MTDTLTEIDIEHWLDELEVISIPCESNWSECLRKGSHTAHWYAGSPCGSNVAICQGRRDELFRHGYWVCYGNGGRPHEEYWTDIKWSRIFQ